MFYNIDLERISKLHAELPMPHTRPTDLTVYDAERRISFPVRLDSGFKLSLTTFIPRMVEVWGEIPIGLLQHLNLRESAYGYVGTTDMTMYPILRPGSFVRIDTDYTKIETIQWRSEYERPIYFIELRNSFACSWCELHGKQLLLIPHPQSGCAVRQYSYPQEAEIVGRVTALAMSIVDPSDNSTADSPKLPGRS